MNLKPQARDHDDPRPHVIEQIDGGEAGVANADDAPVREPKCRLDQDLSAQSVSLLCGRFPALFSCQYRSEGAGTVRNGKAQYRPAQAISGRSICESQRRPLALTK